jgi:hypothetical protein
MARYIKRHDDLGIIYTELAELCYGIPFGVHGYCDSDYAGDLDGAELTAGYVLFINNGPGLFPFTSHEESEDVRVSTDTLCFAAEDLETDACFDTDYPL